MEKRRYTQRFCLLVALIVLISGFARADVGLMLEQPYGRLGRLTGSGHVAIYLSRVCAATPIRLRRCRPGEHGVVIARYHNADAYDWTAIPLVPYLYAVDTSSQIPATMNKAALKRLRDHYRETHLREFILADGGEKTRKNWTQLIGSAYDRKIYVFEIKTTPAQDDALIEKLNAARNKSHFNYFFNNCANFAESIMDAYYPHSVHRSFTADLGLMTPKQSAKSLVTYAKHHPNVKVSIFVIPQVPGTIDRSTTSYGVIEALLKKKQFLLPLVPLTILQPYVTVALVGTYITRGRFNPGKDSIMLNRNDDIAALSRDVDPRQGHNLAPAHLQSVSLREFSRGNVPQTPASGNGSASTTD